MAINRSRPINFTPRGLVDAFDATEKFPGACQALQNVIFDPSNPELVMSRPGVEQLVSFFDNGFLNPGFISVQISIGTRVYGMIASDLNPGNDEPFIYDTATSAFIPITGVTVANTPTSPPITGPWTPPTIASVGVYVLVTHPGFGFGSNFFGWFDLTNPAAPVWNAGNTATNPLTDIPTAVANYFNRAYFAVGNQVQYTDDLDPLTRTNATQALVVGDLGNINALSGLPVQTTSSGVVGALTVFKVNNQVWQVTGDEALANLSLSYISLNIGTNAPRSVVQAPQGIYFSGTGGLYIVDLLGAIRQVTYSLQQADGDIRTPFQNAQVPTRWAAAFTSSIYRVCGETVIRGRGSTNDYWFDEHRRRWNGPHTFVYDCASAMADSNGVNFFILSSANVPGVLIRSDPFQSLSTVFDDLNTPMEWLVKSSTFPKVGDMAKKQVAESTIEVAPARDDVVNYTIVAQNEIGIELGRATVGVAPNGGFVWNHFVWNEDAYWSGPIVSTMWGGGSLWGTIAQGGSGLVWGQGNIQQIPVTVPVPWEFPLVFEKMQLLITSDRPPTIGAFFARYQQTGYQVLGTRIT